MLAVGLSWQFQFPCNLQLCPQASGEARVDTLTKTKVPALIQLDHTTIQADIDATEKLYPLVQQSIRAQVWLPNRSHYMCGRRYCGAWRHCMRDFGGVVND